VLDQESFERTLKRHHENVIFARTVNTLDSFQAQLYTTRSDTVYRVPYRTCISKSSLADVVKKPLTYHESDTPHTIDIPVSSDDLLEILECSQHARGTEASYFLEEIQKRGMTRPAALVLWERVINCMTKKHEYEEVTGSEEDQLAEKISRMHPDNQAFFAASYKANRFSSTIAELLHPCGSAVFFQLTKNL